MLLLDGEDHIRACRQVSSGLPESSRRCGLCLCLEVRLRPGGRLEFTVRPHSTGWILLEVRDNGPGIPKDVVKNINTPFYHAPRPQKGAGLSPAACLRACRADGRFHRRRDLAGSGDGFLDHASSRLIRPALRDDVEFPAGAVCFQRSCAYGFTPADSFVRPCFPDPEHHSVWPTVLANLPDVAVTGSGYPGFRSLPWYQDVFKFSPGSVPALLVPAKIRGLGKHAFIWSASRCESDGGLCDFLRDFARIRRFK